MESMEINISTFINPHFFFITEADSKHRSSFLGDISARIKKSHVGLQNDTFIVDEMVAVYYESDLVRATVIEKSVIDEETGTNIYFCWLVDFAVLIQTDKVFRLPKEIQKITPRAKQACLNNFCYLKQQLELGVKGKIKCVPSTIPCSGVTQYCLDVLFSKYTKLVFEVAERYKNILIGEVLIHKNGKVIYLTKELCNKGLLTTDELIFQRIKYSTTEYLKTHLDAIRQISKNQKITLPLSDTESNASSIKISTNSLDIEKEEIDIDNVQALENGRRRRGLGDRSVSSYSQTSGSKDDQSQRKQQSRIARLQAIIKQAQTQKTLNKNNFSEPKKLSEKKCEVLNKDCLESQNKNDTSDDKTESKEEVTEANSESLNDKTSSGETDLNQTNVAAQQVSSLESVKSEVRTVFKGARALQKIKEMKALEEAKKALEVKHDNIASGTSKSAKNFKEIQRKLAELRKQSKGASVGSTRSEEGFDSSYESSLEDSKIIEQTSEKSKKSPFGDITSQRKTKPAGEFLPAGMEGTYNKQYQKKVSKQSSKEVKSGTRKKLAPKIASSATQDDDCPTIKILEPSGNLTDDLISAGKAEDQTKKEKEEESSSSDFTPREIFTKQDFCRLVAGCTCIKCRLTLEDDDWDAPLKFGPTEEQIKKKSKSKGLVIKPQRIFRGELEEVSSATFVQENEIISVDYSGMTQMEKKMSCKVLVHGESIPNPIKRVAHLNIHKDIYNNINRLNYKDAKRIQHYAFPAITRNQHVFMINDAGSGKTMAYLPILCSFIMEKDARYSQLFKMGGGPIVVILCSNSKKCEEIYDLTKLIFDRQRPRVSLVTYPGHGNISNIDILITMPKILNTLIATRAISFKRLCHFVLEDGDVILKSRDQLIINLLKYGDKVLEHRHCPKSIQLIICAERWTPPMEYILNNLDKVPLVCIGNHLEAALYGKMSFAMKFLDTSCKEENLQQILHDVYKFRKSVIICNPDEVEDIATFLPLKGIEFTAITDVGEEETSYNEVAWSNAFPGEYSVLICTDDIYNTMNITNAQLLIHYSLPKTWTQFKRRFSCFLENNPTPLNIEKKKDPLSTYVFVDENCEPRMSKFCNFIKIAGLARYLPLKVHEFFEEIAKEEEYKRVTRKIELCETLKIIGSCESPHCKKRHVLDKELDNSDILPKMGSIKFIIVKMSNVTTCSIKLLEPFDLNGQSLQKFEDLTGEIIEILARKEKYCRVSKPIENHLYLHKDGDMYCRCRFVEMGEYALVYLIDKGMYCKSDLSSLFKMPAELKKIPPQCYEVHFANLIPPHEDTNFSRSAKYKAQFLVDSNCPNSTMTARVVLQLGNNLWLEDVYEEREMYDKTLPSIGYQLSRELVNQELAEKSEKPLLELFSLCKSADIELSKYKAKEMKIKKVCYEQLVPQWAFLEMDSLNQVHFRSATSPEIFYVSDQRFYKQLEQLEQDIQHEILKPFYPVPQKIEVGKCYLVEDEPTGNYSRGLVINITNDHAHVFCVDHGDDVFAPVSSLKHISDDMILRLPFQSIQCSMYGIKPVGDSWCEDATDLLYKLGFEDGSDIFRTLLVKTCSRQENEVIQGQNSYSVIVKDGFNERHILLNELLIDCGFAIPNGDEIKDFELPEKEEESEDEYIEEICRSDKNITIEVEDDKQEEYFNGDLNQFDIEIFNVAEFLTQMKFPVRKINETKAIEEKKAENDLPPMKAAPAVDYFTPIVDWSQTDSSIKLTIKITDVKAPKVVVKHNRIFQFNTEKNGKKYQLKLILYKNIEKTCQYTILGPEVRVRLTKCNQEEWPRLLHTEEKAKHIRFDLSTIKDDEKPRKMLQLDISDSSSEDDENEKMVVHFCSDLDSEYDYDIPQDDQ